MLKLAFDSLDLGFYRHHFLYSFLFDIFSFGSGSVDPTIFVDPNPEIQTVADPTDPDPTH